MRSRAWRVGISGRLWIFREYGDYREKGFFTCSDLTATIFGSKEVDFGYGHPGFYGGFEGGAAVRQRSGGTAADAHGRRHAEERFPLYHHHGGRRRDRFHVHRAFGAAQGDDERLRGQGSDPRHPGPRRVLWRDGPDRRQPAFGERGGDGVLRAPVGREAGLQEVPGREFRDVDGGHARPGAPAARGGRQDRQPRAAGRLRPRCPAPARHVGNGQRREGGDQAASQAGHRQDDRRLPRNG